MAHYSTEQLIEEIEKRPAIWDSSCEEYSNRATRSRKWEEVVEVLIKDYDGEVDPRTKKELENALQKKWKGIRGCYTRELNRQRAVQTGNSHVQCIRKSQYIYFDKLKFLRNTIKLKQKDEDTEKRERSDSTSSNSQEDEEPEFDPRVKRIKEEVIDFEVPVDPLPYDMTNKSVDEKVHDKTLEDDEEKMFLMSLLSTLKKVPEARKLETRIKIMQVLNEATQAQ